MVFLKIRHHLKGEVSLDTQKCICFVNYKEINTKMEKDRGREERDK